ncbi:MAG: hypothetical protein II822_05355 [Prevotella sp.]|nr:hypothetical protein [Prevotella sp.]
MKKLMMFLFVLGVLPVTVMAQDDDMYFVPTKENKAKEAKTYGMPTKTYYSGSQRSVDDYNRRAWTSATPIDSAGNDIIDFSAVRGVYPDSSFTEVAADDYKYTRRMSRFDDYTPSQAYWEGYRDGRWMSPWYRTSWYSWYDYDPWYWDSPWYYGGYYSWYSPWHYGYYRPWHYGYYGYYGPYWYGGGRHYSTYTSRPIRRTTYQSGRTFGRTNSRTTYDSNRSFGQPSRSSSPSSSFGGGSHRSSGSFGGGGGGGSRSSSGGGRSFGGRR